MYHFTGVRQISKEYFKAYLQKLSDDDYTTNAIQIQIQTSTQKIIQGIFFNPVKSNLFMREG